MTSKLPKDAMDSHMSAEGSTLGNKQVPVAAQNVADPAVVEEHISQALKQCVVCVIPRNIR